MLRKVPLIVILGSTGTGKTKLSIELAQRFGGEIISADSMQVYANLDIVTAKATQEEQSKVKHHLLDVVKPGGEPYTVFNFRNDSLPIINDLLSKSKFPIIVGGTNYYIESLLWDILVPNLSESSETETSDKQHSEEMLTEESMNSMSSELLHEHLKKVDPSSANRIHPKNRRKVIRALEVFYQSDGKQNLTDIYAIQRSQPGGNNLGGPLRYDHTVLFWLKCDQSILMQRLNKRVDDMLKQGLLDEVRNFYDANIKDSVPSNYTKGILQSIGFKEFVPYLETFDVRQDQLIESYLKQNSYEISDGKDCPQGLNLLKNCIDQLKLVTNRYSKKQMKWINNRLIASKNRNVPDIFELNTSDVSQWNQNVYDKAVNIVDSYINDRQTTWEPLPKCQHPSVGLNEEITNYCSVCERLFIGEFQYHIHLKSNKHKKKKEGAKRKVKRLNKDQK